jgi:hydroxyethylthiazole kinase
MTKVDSEIILARVRVASPLVLCLTNIVTVTDCANALLAVGASPVMSDDPSDAAALAAMASALVINIGTISDHQEAVMAAAWSRARADGVPIVLDPVGAGATPRRLAAANRFLEGAAIVRGNASEILALHGAGGSQKGVDSSAAEGLQALEAAALDLAKTRGVVVAVTGETDIVAGPDGRSERIEGGHVLLTRLTGTGCLLSAVTGATLGAAKDDPFEAAAAALRLVAGAGERAAAALDRVGGHLGAYKTLLFDGLASFGLESRPEDPPRA